MIGVFAYLAQVLERELPAAEYEKKRAKISGKRAKDYTRVPVQIASPVMCLLMRDGMLLPYCSLSDTRCMSRTARCFAAPGVVMRRALPAGNLYQRMWQSWTLSRQLVPQEVKGSQ